MTQPTFNERLKAAFDTVDKNSSVNDIANAFALAINVVQEQNAGQDCSATLTDWIDTFTQGKKRMAKWLRNAVTDLADLVGVEARIVDGDPVMVQVRTTAPMERRDNFASILRWLIASMDQASKNHLKQFNYARGQGKAAGTRFREESVVTILAAANGEPDVPAAVGHPAQTTDPSENPDLPW